MADKADPGLGGQLVTPGIILGTERFEDCLAFYRDTLGLPVWFEKPESRLACLRFGSGYLMIETGGVARSTGRKTQSENPAMLRFNVDDVEAVADWLRAKGVEVVVRRYDWGIVGTFLDPDGNACELKDAGDAYFAQVEGHTQR